MALRNQPYFPLYVQDYLTDEKLNMCEWSSIGIYSKIMCVLHKQDDYGSILFKQNSKQNLSMIENFASILVKHIPCQLVDMINALNDLIDNGVLNIEDNKLFQKRMVKDGQISLKRSLAGSTGGGNPNLFKQISKQISKQTSKQITEYENENEDDNKDLIKDIIDYLNSVLSAKYKYNTKKTNDCIKARLKDGFVFDDFIIVIDKKFKDWNGTDMSKHLVPETLFGNKFEGYLNQVINKKQTKGDETLDRAKRFEERVLGNQQDNSSFMLTI